MIVFSRLDHRLLHGQTAFAWMSAIDANCILVVGDKIADDELGKTALRLAKPMNVKLVIKGIKAAIEALNSEVTDSYKLFIIFEDVRALHACAKACADIKSINLGGTKSKEGSRQISKALHFDDEDLALLKELIDSGMELEIRQTPHEAKQYLKDLI